MSTERIDHVAHAKALMIRADGPNPTRPLSVVGAAQVHATLALVEQQRIANLIALRQADSDVLRDDEWDYVDAVIREGLGLS